MTLLRKNGKSYAKRGSGISERCDKRVTKTLFFLRPLIGAGLQTPRAKSFLSAFIQLSLFSV